MIERYREPYGSLPHTLATDATHGNGELLQRLEERDIAPAQIRVKENPNGRANLYGIDQFPYVGNRHFSTHMPDLVNNG
jgi:hypothetical protein